MASVFVSYRRKPSAILAQLIVKDLKEQNIEVYLDIERMEGAGAFPSRLLQAIDVSDVFVCLLGEDTLDSEWVQREIQHAHEVGKPMIPVFQESYTPIPLDQVPNPHIKALLEHDGVYVFDVKNVYVPQAVEALARMIENTAHWLKQTPPPAEAVAQPILTVNIETLAGQQFGQYEIRDLLGMGGMSAVYRAYQENLMRDVAMKVLPPSFASQQTSMERFLREARTAAALEHAHIVPVYDYGNYGGLSYVVMRLLSGGSLAERLEQAESEQKPLPSLEEAADILSKLAGALDYAHSRGVIHRDIKANNIMFDDQGSPFIVDFGIAKLTHTQNALTGTGVAMGTPLYMAPEQWRGESVTPATDQYALGVTAYAMLTGHLPFEAPTPYALMNKHLNEQPAPPQTWRADLPESIRKVLDQAMAKRPLNRFPSAKAFADAFEEAVQASGIESEPTGFFTDPLPDKPVPTPSPLLSGTPVPDYLPRATPNPAPPANTPAPGNTPGEVRSPYSTPPDMTPPGQPAAPASMGQTPGDEPLPITNPTATVLSTNTPRPEAQGGGVVNPPTPHTPPSIPTLDQAQVVSPLPSPENVPLPPAQGATPPPGYIQAVTPSGQQVYVPQETLQEPNLPPTAVMAPPTQHRGHNPMPWVLASVIVIVLGLLGLAALLIYNQGQQAEAQLTQAAALAAILEASETPTPTETVSPTITPTPTETLTPTATASPTPATPVVQAISDLSARLGPGTDYPEVATLDAEGRLDATGISEDGAWYQVLLPDGSFGWIVSSNALVNIFGDLDLLPIIPAPTSTPTVTPSPTRTPSVTPTETISPTRTPRPTRTPAPTDTLEPTVRPSRTPSARRTPTESPESAVESEARPTQTRAASSQGVSPVTRTPAPVLWPSVTP